MNKFTYTCDNCSTHFVIKTDSEETPGVCPFCGELLEENEEEENEDDD